MNVSCDMTDPIVIVPILGQLRHTLRHVDVGGMTVAEDHTARDSVPLDHFYNVLVRFLFDEVHYRNPCSSAKQPEYPSQLWKVSHIAPSLLSYECLIDVYLICKPNVALHILFDVATYCLSNDNEEVSHCTVIHEEVSLP